MYRKYSGKEVRTPAPYMYRTGPRIRQSGTANNLTKLTICICLFVINKFFFFFSRSTPRAPVTRPTLVGLDHPPPLLGWHTDNELHPMDSASVVLVHKPTSRHQLSLSHCWGRPPHTCYSDWIVVVNAVVRRASLALWGRRARWAT